MTSRNSEKKIALSLTGGAIIGLCYEFGALEALHDVGFRAHHFDFVTGVSAGAHAGMLFTNYFTPREAADAFFGNPGAKYKFESSRIFTFNWEQVIGKALSSSRNITRAFGEWAWQRIRRQGGQLSLESEIELIENAGKEITFPLFNLHGLEREYSRLIAQNPRATTNFEELETTLMVTGAQYNRMRRIAMGPNHLGDIEEHNYHFMRDVKVTDAVVASGAFPDFFEPYFINGFYLSDGALYNKANLDLTMHMSDPDLIMFIHPITTMEGQSMHKRGLLSNASHIYHYVTNSVVQRDVADIKRKDNPPILIEYTPDRYAEPTPGGMWNKNPEMYQRGYRETMQHIQSNPDLYKKIRDEFAVPIDV